MNLVNRHKSIEFVKKNMKTTLFLLSLFFMLINLSCTDDCCPVSSNNNYSNNSIQGSGYMVTEIRDFTYFHSIHIATAGTVNLTQSDTQNVRVTVDDNLMQYIRIIVTNNILTISVEPGYSLKNMHLSVDIKLPELYEIHTSSAGNFIGQNLFTSDELRLFSSSAGNIFLNLEANYLYTNLSSAGNANLNGTASIHNAIVSSAGGLHAFGLITDTTTINLSSAGNAEVYVNDLLNANLSSAGSLYYKGNPIINAIVTSLGMIINAN